MIWETKCNIHDTKVIENAMKYLSNIKNSYIVELKRNNSNNNYIIAHNIVGKIIGINHEKITIEFDETQMSYNKIKKDKLFKYDLLFIINNSIKELNKVFLSK